MSAAVSLVADQTERATFGKALRLVELVQAADRVLRRRRLRRPPPATCPECGVFLAPNEPACLACYAPPGTAQAHTVGPSHFEIPAWIWRSNWPDGGTGSRRPSRAKEATEPSRTVIAWPHPRDADAALRWLMTWPVRRCYRDPDGGRREWLSEVWIELVCPPAASAELTDVEERIQRAIWRAELTLRAGRPPPPESTRTTKINLPQTLLRDEAGNGAAPALFGPARGTRNESHALGSKGLADPLLASVADGEA